VPSAAVQVSQAGNYVYVIENGTAIAKPVEVSRSTSDEMIIRSGLSGGEQVVTDGHLLLGDHTPVRVVER
jgi:hypothetical protein